MGYTKPVHEETILGDTRTIIDILGNGKRIYIDGNGINRDEAHEIIIRLTKTWGTDFEKQELKDLALMDC